MTQKNSHITTTTPTIRATSWKIWGIRCGILLLAFFLIAMGIWNGGASDVLKKAAAICAECIGLG